MFRLAMLGRAPTVARHSFRRNYVSMLSESGIDPRAAMKIGGYTDCQTTVNIFARIREEMLKEGRRRPGGCSQEEVRKKTGQKKAAPR